MLWSHNDRPLWMLLTAFIVLAVAAGAGLLLVLILTRPREELLDGEALAAGGLDAVLKIARLASANPPATAKSVRPRAPDPGAVSSN